jgi:hypothetical protein
VYIASVDNTNNNKYRIGRIATLRNELKKLVKDVQAGKVDRAIAADEILKLREEIDKVTEDLNSIEHKD